MIVFVWTEIKICVYYRLRLQSSSCGWDLIKWVALCENCLAWRTSRHADVSLQWFLHFNIYTYTRQRLPITRVPRLKSNKSQPTFNYCSGGWSGWWHKRQPDSPRSTTRIFFLPQMVTHAVTNPVQQGLTRRFCIFGFDWSSEEKWNDLRFRWQLQHATVNLQFSVFHSAHQSS